MNLLFDNNIFFFKSNDIEKNLLYLKLKKKFNLDDTKIHSIINIYLPKTRLKCVYDKNIENIVYTYINEIL